MNSQGNSDRALRVRNPRRRADKESNARSERLARGLEELWEQERLDDSEDALSRALREIVGPD